jgi:hypothetical protein
MKTILIIPRAFRPGIGKQPVPAPGRDHPVSVG